MSVSDSPSNPTCLTRSTLSAAVLHLTRRDRALARIVRTHGAPPLWARPPGFATLSRIILEQQVSLRRPTRCTGGCESSCRGAGPPRRSCTKIRAGLPDGE